MPLDTSSYSLALLRLDGRRWNELRHTHGQISIQAAADGSSYFEMGNTKVICTVSGPEEATRRGPGGGGGQQGQERSDNATILFEVNVAGFSGVDKKRSGRGDKRITELSHTLQTTFQSHTLTHLYPHSTITLHLQILQQDGSLLASCINASTLALIDAGIPMMDYVAACTAGSSASYGSNDETADPILDLNGLEEAELPFLTVGVLCGDDRVRVQGPQGDEHRNGVIKAQQEVVVLVMETRCQIERVETMLAVAVDGCGQVKRLLEGVVRRHGKDILRKSLT